MGKRIDTPTPPETVTIPKSSFDNIFRTLEDMKDEIKELRKRLEGIPQPQVVLNVKEAAEYCGVSRWTIGNYTKQKKIQKVVSGCKTGYTIDKLNKVRKIDT